MPAGLAMMTVQAAGEGDENQASGRRRRARGAPGMSTTRTRAGAARRFFFSPRQRASSRCSARITPPGRARQRTQGAQALCVKTISPSSSIMARDHRRAMIRPGRGIPGRHTTCMNIRHERYGGRRRARPRPRGCEVIWKNRNGATGKEGAAARRPWKAARVEGAKRRRCPRQPGKNMARGCRRAARMRDGASRALPAGARCTICATVLRHTMLRSRRPGARARAAGEQPANRRVAPSQVGFPAPAVEEGADEASAGACDARGTRRGR